MLIFATVAPSTAQTDLTKTLQGIERRYNRPRTMQMHFEHSLTGQGRIGRTESGILYLQKPGRMRWDYTHPKGKLFLTDGKYVWFYSPNIGRVERSPMKESGDLRAPLAFLMGRLDFRRDFGEFRTKPEGADMSVTATPKSARAPYTIVEFVVTPEYRIRTLKVTGHDQSVMTFHLSDEKTNPVLGSTLFRFVVPKGVEVVDVDEDDAGPEPTAPPR
jgi:outer membrane lipoprotein carrier protein